MLKAGKTRAEIYIGNTTEFDTKSSQVKVTIGFLERGKIKFQVTSCKKEKGHISKQLLYSVDCPHL